MPSFSEAPEVISNGNYVSKKSKVNGVTNTIEKVSDASVLDASAGQEQVYSVLDQVAQLNELSARNDYPLQAVTQVIVCGSQSAGKSSVLEAITEIPFPSNLDLCTRYPTRVTIRRSVDSGALFRIIPSNDRRVGNDRQRRVSLFKKSFTWHDWEQNKHSIMQSIVQQADDLIFENVRPADRGWAKDTLDITISSPTKRPLQVLDLPGLIETNPKDESFITLVKSMVENEMNKEHCLILAVIEGHGDVNTHKILQLCAKHDKTGQRTIAIITKPDLEDGLQKAPSWIQLIHDGASCSGYKNMWHVLRNRTNDERLGGTSSESRDENERILFRKEPWKALAHEFKGVEALRHRLRDMIFQIATKVLPEISRSMQKTLKQRRLQLREISGHSYDDKELPKVFEDAVTRLCNKARDHSRGIYEYDTIHFPATHPINLRARVVDQNWIFHDQIINAGHAWERIGTKVPDPDEDLLSIPGTDTDRVGGEHVKNILDQMKETNAVSMLDAGAEQKIALEPLHWKTGRELPGYDNSERINDLFWRLSERWYAMTLNHIEKVYNHLENYFTQIAYLAFSPSDLELVDTLRGFANSKLIAQRFVQQYIMPNLQRRRIAARRELQELERDRRGAAQNYSKDFLKQRRHERNMRAKSRDMMAISMITKEGKEISDASWAKSKGDHSQTDIIEHTSLDFLTSSRIHYLITRATFIANVNMQVVERHFMRELDNAISKVAIEGDDAQVTWVGNVDVVKKLVAAPRDTARQQAAISKEISDLEKMLKVLKVSGET